MKGKYPWHFREPHSRCWISGPCSVRYCGSFLWWNFEFYWVNRNTLPFDIKYESYEFITRNWNPSFDKYVQKNLFSPCFFEKFINSMGGAKWRMHWFCLFLRKVIYDCFNFVMFFVSFLMNYRECKNDISIWIISNLSTLSCD